MAFDISRLPELYEVDPERVALAKARQRAVWEGRKPDQWPLLLGGGLMPGQQSIPSPNLKEAFDDIDAMICGQVRGACGAANARSDSVPSARGNYGTGMTLSTIGLEQEVFPDKMPWLKQHCTRDQAARLSPDSIRIQGTFAQGLEFMRRFRALMGDRLPLYCMDTQGPFGLAYLLMGDEFLYALHDDPPLVHHVLEFCLELGIRTHTWMKEISGEALNECHHSNSIYGRNLGIRVCEDSSAIVGPAAIEEFVAPYTGRLAAHFGGAWVHYCGRNDALTRAICRLPDVRGINFGHVPGREHEHVFEDELALVAASGKVYVGTWPLRPGESGRQHLERLRGWARQGCLIADGGPALQGPGAFASAAEALEYWYSLPV